jgi:hypothetical protein
MFFSFSAIIVLLAAVEAAGVIESVVGVLVRIADVSVFNKFRSSSFTDAAVGVEDDVAVGRTLLLLDDVDFLLLLLPLVLIRPPREALLRPPRAPPAVEGVGVECIIVGV